ncbi:fasciclin domain-containing protein [Zunongwangia endophytica]|uniref:Fasciclin domain-containing protein n=1 Tax=Zunongwangia endophytica TaxID=1808945 RepID=A0ABV8HGS0_9FLAO|nr:fasciclin domain-containing protein [Zunongwangia endophytica]MDN3593355.1 fasciclin domain-containing protein [Zunongwangia endophytica]
MKKKTLLLMMLLGFITTFTFAQEKEFFSTVDDTENYSALELAQNDDQFSIFLSFLEASGLDTSMEYADGFTIFIPTNDAFGEMKVSKLSELTSAENKTKLIDFVKHYIVPEKVYKNQFNDSQVIAISEDESIKINTDMNGNSVSIGGANIISSDIETKNGVVHVVDQLLTTTDYFSSSY